MKEYSTLICETRSLTQLSSDDLKNTSYYEHKERRFLIIDINNKRVFLPFKLVSRKYGYSLLKKLMVPMKSNLL